MLSYLWWCIILVILGYYEDEGKISLKGTSMKLLVLAWYAQYWVGAGRKSLWATIMAYSIDPLTCGDLTLWNIKFYDLGLNLSCGEIYG